jgi:hypothetical protein
MIMAMGILLLLGCHCDSPRSLVRHGSSCMSVAFAGVRCWIAHSFLKGILD